jgi:hypothetical protein
MSMIQRAIRWIAAIETELESLHMCSTIDIVIDLPNHIYNPLEDGAESHNRSFALASSVFSWYRYRTRQTK